MTLYVQSLGYSYFAYRQDPRYKVVTQPQELETMMNALRASKAFAFDYETNGLAWWRDKRPCGVAFTTKAASDPHPLNWYVPFRHITGQQQLSPEVVIGAQKELLEDPEKLKIAHNIKFEQHMSRVDGIKLRGPRCDTMIEARFYNEDALSGLKERIITDLQNPEGKLREDLLSQDVKRLAKRRGLGIEAYRDQVGFSEVDIFLAGPYAGFDSEGTWNLHEFYEAKGVRSYYQKSPRSVPGARGIYDIEMKLTDVLCRMEATGQPIDVEYLKKLDAYLLEEKAKAEGEFFVTFGCEYFNLGSDDQLRDFLMKGLKLRWEQTTASGNPSVDYEAIDELAKQRPALKSVLRFKEVEKKLSTYTMALIERADDNGVIHCDYKQVGTNCMPAGELVLTSRGYLPVEDVLVGDQVLTHEGRRRMITAAGPNGQAKVVEVTLENGLKLKTTENHAYLTPSGWRMPSDLKPGDEVVIHSEPERWLAIPGWPDFMISSWGRVQNHTTGNILKQRPKGKWGHLKVQLYRNGAQTRTGGDRKDVPVHRLVALAFLPGTGHEVRHLNGCAWDNTASNLAWGTRLENAQDAVDHGTMSRRTNGQAKLAQNMVDEITSTPFVRAEARVGLIGSDRMLATKFGVSRELIRDVRLGKRWQPVSIDSLPRFGVSRVSTVSLLEEALVYGLTVEEDHSHVTGGIVTHNTGRLSCKAPNLQNIASDDPMSPDKGGTRTWQFWHAFSKKDWKSEVAKCLHLSGAAKEVALMSSYGMDPESIKRAFIVHRRPTDPVWEEVWARYPGAKLVRQFWDYSQIELRVLADYTKDKGLVKAYAEDKDIHDEVEFAVFGTRTEIVNGKKVEGANRRKAKVINFGLSYCMSPIGFARQIKEVTPEEAQGYFDEYNRKFPGVPAFRGSFWAFIRMNGCQFDNKFGRTRHVSGIISDDHAIRKRFERMSIATLIQGTAAELTKQSLVLIDEALEAGNFTTRLSQTIHDEIQLDGPVQEFAQTARIAHQIMTDYPDFIVPIKVDGKASVTNWPDKQGIPGL